MVQAFPKMSQARSYLRRLDYRTTVKILDVLEDSSDERGGNCTTRLHAQQQATTMASLPK